MYQHLDKVFPVLLTKLSDPADEVVVLNIQVLAEICSANPAGEGGRQRGVSSARYCQQEGGAGRRPSGWWLNGYR